MAGSLLTKANYNLKIILTKTFYDQVNDVRYHFSSFLRFLKVIMRCKHATKAKSTQPHSFISDGKNSL